MAVKGKSLFNSTSKAKNIFPLLTYTVNKDLFSRKLKIELLKAYDKNTESVSFFINLKAQHLLRFDFKEMFIEANKVIFDIINVRDSQKEILVDDLIICTDNASNNLSVFYEINKRTSTITFISTVKPPEEQMTAHIRSNITKTHYLPGEPKIFENKSTMYADSLYTLKTMDKLNRAIELNAVKSFNGDCFISSAYIPLPEYSGFDKNLWDLLKSEAVESISRLTGLDKRDSSINDYNSNIVFIRRDKDGFHVTLG